MRNRRPRPSSCLGETVQRRHQCGWLPPYRGQCVTKSLLQVAASACCFTSTQDHLNGSCLLTRPVT